MASNYFLHHQVLALRTLSVVFIASMVLSCSQKFSKSQQGKDTLTIKDVIIHTGSGYRAPCEPTICIDPTNPDRVIAGSVLDNLYISSDGGRTWQKDRLKSTYGVYGDPVIRVGGDGTYYYSHLTNPDGQAYTSQRFLERILIQSSIDKGETWTNGSSPPGDTLKDHDKQWLAIDPFDHSVLMGWTEFDKYGSKSEADKSRILFSRSTDKGLTWSAPAVISQYEGDCIDDDMTTEGCTPAVGVDGTYYLTWAYDGKIWFDKSTDKGLNWLATDRVVANQVGGWSYDIPGIMRCNGMPIIEVDHSSSPHKGRIYINWSDQRNGADDTDIWIISSDNGGDTWSSPKRVNDDPAGKQQFLSWMDVDPSTGYIYIVFYDRRHHEGNTTDVYLAYSIDGGTTFTNVKINDTPFTPQSNQVFFGDYNDVSAYKGMIRPIWTQQKENTLSVHTAIIDHNRK